MNIDTRLESDLNEELWRSRRFKIYAIACQTFEQYVTLNKSLAVPIEGKKFTEPLPEEWAVLRYTWDQERGIMQYLVFSPSFEPVFLGREPKIIHEKTRGFKMENSRPCYTFEPREMTLLRPKIFGGGMVQYISLRVCRCGVDSRGPIGGVCGNCGGAIARLDEIAPRENES